MKLLYKTPQLLSFVSNNDLFKFVEKVMKKAQTTDEDEEALYRNTLDPFSAIFDASASGLTLKSWLLLEKMRQKQKTLQNAIGDFHENIIGAMPGWKKLPVGNIIDDVSDEQRIIAEVKNKFNTTKGSDKKTLYDNLENELNEKYRGYTGYYIEIIPKNGKRYNKVFVPSDNTTGTNRPANEKIRVIDGYSFYSLASGNANALHELYKVLPKIIASILDKPSISGMTTEELFITFFHRAYKESL